MNQSRKKCLPGAGQEVQAPEGASDRDLGVKALGQEYASRVVWYAGSMPGLGL